MENDNLLGIILLVILTIVFVIWILRIYVKVSKESKENKENKENKTYFKSLIKVDYFNPVILDGIIYYKCKLILNNIYNINEMDCFMDALKVLEKIGGDGFISCFENCGFGIQIGALISSNEKIKKYEKEFIEEDFRVKLKDENYIKVLVENELSGDLLKNLGMIHYKDEKVNVHWLGKVNRWYLIKEKGFNNTLNSYYSIINK